MTKPSEISGVIGVILAGGLSRRMGGGDKGLADLDGLSMLQRVINRLRPQCSQLVINANGDASRFADYALPVVADTIAGNTGPLAGVLAGLRWAGAQTPGVTSVVTVSSDAPFIPENLVSRLSEALNHAEGRIALAESRGHLHPVIGLWPVDLADDLEDALRAGIRKVLTWTDRHGTVPVVFDEARCGSELIDPFFNVNTPAELEEARRFLAMAGS